MKANWVIVALVLVGAAGALWLFRDSAETPPVDAPVPAAETGEPVLPRGPLHPLPATEFESPAAGELVPLPPLDESDSYFALALVDLFGADLETMLVGEGLIDRTAATVDSLTRGRVPERVRPVGRLPSPFVVEAAGANGPYTLSPDNYARYDDLVDRLVNADTDELVSTYSRFYPLFQEAYERLGYPDGYFNDRVVYVIDHLLQTPTPAEPIPLVRPHVLYQFEDPALEALSSGQKLLLRMGPDNAGRVKQLLETLRTKITADSTG